MLNIITGIFLDAAMNAAHGDQDEVINEQLRAKNSVRTLRNPAKAIGKVRRGSADTSTARHALSILCLGDSWWIIGVVYV